MIRDLTSAELDVVNQCVESLLIFTDGCSPARRALLVSHAAAMIVGVTMAGENWPRRRAGGGMIDGATERHFQAVKDSAFIHAIGGPVGTPPDPEAILAGWTSRPGVAGNAAAKKLQAMSSGGVPQ